MALPKGEELEPRYRALFDNDAIQGVVHARTPNDALPVDEDDILDFVKASDKAHADYVRAIFPLSGMEHFG